MNQVRVPGLIWAIGIIVVIGLAHSNEAWLAQYGIEPFYVDLVVTLLIGVLKGLDLRTDQLQQALDLIDRLLKQSPPPPVPPMEDMRSAKAPVVDDFMIWGDDIPERPSKLKQFFLG